MEYDHVRGLDPGRIGGDVVNAAIRPVGQAGLAQQLPGLVLVPGRELEVHRAGDAALEQLDLDRADSAADLEHRGVPDAPPLEEVHHLPSGLVEAALAVPPGEAGGEPGSGEAVAPARLAARSPATSIADYRDSD